jgi:arylsulfate sulfotransferase
MPKLIESPRIFKNPNPRVPLVAIVEFRAARPVVTTLVVDDGRRRRTITYGEKHDPSKGLAIIGMRADTEFRVSVSVRDSAGATEGPIELTYRTPPLPADGTLLPRVTVKKVDAALMEPGFTILSMRRRANVRAIWMTPKQAQFTNRWGLLVAFDEEGHIVWYYHADARVAGIHRLANGNLFFNTADFRAIELDMLGNIVRQFYAGRRPQGPVNEPGAIPIDAQSLHHQPHEMPNGNFLALTASARTIENYYTSETDPDAPRKTQSVVGDCIVEYTPEGRIVWSWDAFDYLDVWRFGYRLMEVFWHTRGFPNHLDWTHGNGVSYDPFDDSVIVSLRHQDAVIKIDRATKEIKWILGDHKGWNAELSKKLLRPVGAMRWPYHGHNPRVTEEGHLVMYDNGIIRAIPYDTQVPPSGSFSRGVEYAVDAKRMEVRQVWSSEALPDELKVVSWAMGDAHRLPLTGNMLVIDSLCLPAREQLNPRVKLADLTWHEWLREEWHPSDFPFWVRVRELKHTEAHETVWEIHLDHEQELITWEGFSGTRVTSLYPPEAVES